MLTMLLILGLVGGGVLGYLIAKNVFGREEAYHGPTKVVRVHVKEPGKGKLFDFPNVPQGAKVTVDNFFPSPGSETKTVLVRFEHDGHGNTYHIRNINKGTTVSVKEVK